MIYFGVLGPLVVRRDAVPVPIGAPLLRAVLAALLCRAGRPISGPELADTLWEGAPPRSARKTTQVYVHRLRRLLGEDLPLRHDPAGYRLEVGPDQLDALRFAELVERGHKARQQGDLNQAGDLLRQALQLWRGEPYADVLSGELVTTEARRLVEQRLLVVEDRLAVDLDVGRHAELTAELEQLTRAHPYRERLPALRMLALYRSGRQADALAVFRDTRVQLATQIGIEPGGLLRRLHTAILRADGWLAQAPVDHLDRPDRPVVGGKAGPAGPAAPAAPAGPVPWELPAGVAGFVGRSGALRQLDALISDPSSRSPGTVPVSVITGPPGVGKTALAMHWAHRAAGAFPDGQLYLDLRGFDPTGAPVEPAQAVRRLLDTLQVPPEAVPTELDAQAGTFRSRMAGRRMLVVLDNARDADQVRQLLPGSPGCLVIITSRSQLPGLAASHAAGLVRLAPFTPAEARELLAQRLGRARVAAEPQAVTEIVTRCARLPVALAVAAARAAATPEFPLEATATQLREAGGTLNALASTDPATDVRAVFSWSYHALRPPAARLFRLLGLPAGPEITGPAVASLAGVPLSAARTSLAELVQAQLVTEPAPGRYALHDLLRDYAAELTEAVDSQADRREGDHRLLDHYLHTAHAANLLLHPQLDPVKLVSPHPGAVPEPLADPAAAADWLMAEHPVLLAAVIRASAAGFDTHTWQLAEILWAFLNRRRYLYDQLRAETAVLAAARRAADQPRQVLVHCVLARVYAKLGRYPDAHTQLGYAGQLAGQLGDLAEQARTCLARAFVADQQGDPAQAVHHAQQAYDHLLAARLPRAQARALHALGSYHSRLAGHEQALACWQAALVLHQEAGDHRGEAETMDRLGSAHHQLGDHRQAATCYQRAIRAYRTLGRSYEQGRTLEQLGDLQLAARGPAAACRAWRQALTILDRLGHPDADHLRRRLDRLSPGWDGTAPAGSADLPAADLPAGQPAASS